MNKTPKLHNIALFAVALGLACSDAATAADAASLVKAGRADLAKQTSRGIHDAHKKFTEALKVSPNNAQANLLSAGTHHLSARPIVSGGSFPFGPMLKVVARK